jgi:hypothetical protein
LAVELFNGEGHYEHRFVDVEFCLTTRDERLIAGVFRLPVGSQVWEQVGDVQRVSAHCYVAHTPLCVLAIGVSGKDLYAPTYRQPFSASVLYEQFVVSCCAVLCSSPARSLHICSPRRRCPTMKLLN